MSVLPLESRVLLRVEKDVEEQTEGGLFVPGTHRKDYQLAEVVAVGPGSVLTTGAGLSTQPVDVKVGDRVYFRRDSGIKIDGLTLIDDFDLLAKEQ